MIRSFPLRERVEVVCFVVMADDAHAFAGFFVAQKLAELDAWVDQDVQLDLWYGWGCCEGHHLPPC